MHFVYRPARLQFVPAVLPRCHWHLLCSSHTTITATISRDLWIPQAGASISARIPMLCWHESDWMSKRNLDIFSFNVFQTKGRCIDYQDPSGIYTVKIARSCQWCKCFNKIETFITKVAVGQVDLPQAVSDAFFQKAWMQMLVGAPSK